MDHSRGGWGALRLSVGCWEQRSSCGSPARRQSRGRQAGLPPPQCHRYRQRSLDVPVKTGQNAGPTGQGITTRIASWDPGSAIATVGLNGAAAVIMPISPQLVLLPVVVNATDGSSTWPSGSGNVRVVGFALFVITGYANQGKQVDGEYITAQLSEDTWTTGSWVGTGSNTAYTEELTS
jgi:hypothetical protein